MEMWSGGRFKVSLRDLRSFRPSFLTRRLFSLLSPSGDLSPSRLPSSSLRINWSCATRPKVGGVLHDRGSGRRESISFFRYFPSFPTPTSGSLCLKTPELTNSVLSLIFSSAPHPTQLRRLAFVGRGLRYKWRALRDENEESLRGWGRSSCSRDICLITN